jgi:hypothetical protein
MKATVANTKSTAPASPFCLLSCIGDGLSDLCNGKGLLLLSSHDLDALSTRNLRQMRRTVIPVTRSTTGVLATNHAVKLSGIF